MDREAQLRFENRDKFKSLSKKDTAAPEGCLPRRWKIKSPSFHMNLVVWVELRKVTNVQRNMAGRRPSMEDPVGQMGLLKLFPASES